MAISKKSRNKRTKTLSPGLLSGSRKKQPWENTNPETEQQLTTLKKFKPSTYTKFVLGNTSSTIYTVPANKQAKLVFASVSFQQYDPLDTVQIIRNLTAGTDAYKVYTAGTFGQNWNYEEAPLFIGNETIDAYIISLGAGSSKAWITIHVIEEFPNTGYYPQA